MVRASTLEVRRLPLSLGGGEDMDRERRHELEHEEAQGFATFEEPEDPDRRLGEQEEAQGTQLYAAPDGDRLREAALEEAEGGGWFPEAPEAPRLDAIRRRRRALLGAMVQLEEALSGPRGAVGWSDRLAEAVEATRRSLAEHIAHVEGRDGLLAEVARVAPWLQPQIGWLEADHVTLAEALADLAGLLGTGPLGETEARRVRRRVTSVLGRLARHRQNGADLVYDAYNVDIGGG